MARRYDPGKCAGDHVLYVEPRIHGVVGLYTEIRDRIAIMEYVVLSYVHRRVKHKYID